jgi:hypothetical protein
VRFIRFVLGRRDQDSGIEEGLFRLAYELRDSALVEPTDRESLAETLVWFDQNLDTPDRFNRTRSKGFYRRKARGIAWFKDTATEHLTRMHGIKKILEQYGHPVVMLSEARVGYLVYEDPFQVIAEPFSGTRTG